MKRKVRYTIDAMRGVVEHYRARRVQVLCPNCKYILFSEMEDPTVAPPDFEEMRRAQAWIQQCDEHNRPEFQWLHAIDADKAARWLTKKGNQSKHGFLVFEEIAEEMKAALYKPQRETVH